MYKSKEILRSIYETECLIRKREERLERLREIAEHSGIGYGEEGGRGTRTVQDTKAEMVAMIVDTEEEIGKLKGELLGIRLECMRMIDSLEHADVFYMRYFEYMKWEDIAKAKYRSIDWVFRVHRQGLSQLENNVN